MNEYTRKDFLREVVIAIAFLFCVLLVGMAILSLVGCSSKACEPSTCPEKFVEVKVPVPQKCDFYLYPKPDINTSTMQGVYDSVTRLAIDGVQIRKELDIVPCLNIIYKVRE